MWHYCYNQKPSKETFYYITVYYFENKVISTPFSASLQLQLIEDFLLMKPKQILLTSATKQKNRVNFHIFYNKSSLNFRVLEP